MRLNIYIPQDPRKPPLGIVPASAIVGAAADASGLVRVDFEGNIYETENLQDYESRIRQAAGRYAIRYPTVARGSVPEAELRCVGEVDTTDWRVYLSEDAAIKSAVAEWLGV